MFLFVFVTHVHMVRPHNNNKYIIDIKKCNNNVCNDSDSFFRDILPI